MDGDRRRRLAAELLDGYPSGPTASIEATAAAHAKVGRMRAVVLVEGVSDQIALETLADRRGRHLETERVAILPVGGAHAVRRFLSELGPRGDGIEIAGLYDAGEEDAIRRAVTEAGVGTPQGRVDLGRLGFHVCVEDLEDELIRAVGPTEVELLFDSQGDLDSFRRFQRQPVWRGRAVAAQMRRFLGAGSGRKLRYARLFARSVHLDRVPRPLDDVLARV